LGCMLASGFSPAEVEKLKILEAMAQTKVIDFGTEKFRGSPNAQCETPLHMFFHGAPRKGGYLEEYRCLADFPRVPPHVIAAVQLEVDELKELNPDMYAECHRVDAPGLPHAEVVRQVINLPWPISNREYIINRLVHEDPESKVLILKSQETDAVDREWPRNNGSTVRVQTFDSYVRLAYEPSCAGTRLTSWYFEDSGGSIPAWLVNYIATSVVPKGFLALWEKCRQYMKENNIPDPMANEEQTPSLAMPKKQMQKRNNCMPMGCKS